MSLFRRMAGREWCALPETAYANMYVSVVMENHIKEIGTVSYVTDVIELVEKR